MHRHSTRCPILVATLILQFFVFAASSPNAAGAQVESEVDPVTLELFNSYVNVAGKISTNSVNAAIELVAARGAGSKPFRDLLTTEFERNCENRDNLVVRRKLLKVIRKIIATEGRVSLAA